MSGGFPGGSRGHGWWWLLCGGILVLGGCATPPNPVQPVTPEPPEAPVAKSSSSLGSLWQPENGRAYMFEDLRASRVGDIVVVKIVEEHKGSKNASTSADRESTYETSFGGSFFGLNDFISAIVSPVKAEADTKSEFSGDGATSREDTLTGTIAARVVEVMLNGDLRIEGRRAVTVNSEKQTMAIRGIVRRIDLDTQNTVLSSAIGDAEIEYSGLGVVDEVQRPGWAIRLWNYLTPL